LRYPSPIHDGSEFLSTARHVKRETAPAPRCIIPPAEVVSGSLIVVSFGNHLLGSSVPQRAARSIAAAASLRPACPGCVCPCRGRLRHVNRLGTGPLQRAWFLASPIAPLRDRVIAWVITRRLFGLYGTERRATPPVLSLILVACVSVSIAAYFHSPLGFGCARSSCLALPQLRVDHPRCRSCFETTRSWPLVGPSRSHRFGDDCCPRTRTSPSRRSMALRPLPLSRGCSERVLLRGHTRGPIGIAYPSLQRCVGSCERIR